MEFRFIPQEIPDVLLVEGQRVSDDRGFFQETFRASAFAGRGLPPFVQENRSRSRRGVLRGLHYQLEPEAIGKLVWCPRGRVFDVAVDLRGGSPTYGRWVSVELGEEGDRMLYVPPGVAHGFCTLSDLADVCYKQTGYYCPEHDRGFRWNDPAVGIRWPIETPLLSPRDDQAPLLADAENNFRYTPAR